MQVRKYYKDFNAETIFDNNEEIDVTRIIVYLKNDMLAFIDIMDESTKNVLINQIHNGKDLKIKDNFTSGRKRELNIPRENITMIEINENVILGEDDFQEGNKQAMVN